MLELKSSQENETHKILFDFEIQTDNLIPARRIELVSFNKTKGEPSGFCHSYRLLSESKKKKQKVWQILGPCQKAKKKKKPRGTRELW